MTLRGLASLLAAAAAALALSSPARGQTTGGLSGRVVDAYTQAPVADAVVIATSPSLQGEQTAVTDSTGAFGITLIPAGVYTLVVQREGYQPFTQAGLTVRLDRTIKVTLLILPDSLAGEPLEIAVARPVIATTSVQSGGTITREQMELVPYGRTTRNFEAVVTSVPGAHPDRYGATLNGAGSPETAYIVDGVAVNDPTYGHQGSTLLQDFVQEVDVKSGGYQAEYGRASGGVVNVVTKSGGNEFHGSVFGNWSPWEAPRKRIGGQVYAISQEAHQRYNLDAGVELGGPILHDRLWFFAGFAPQVVSTSWDRIISARSDDGSGQPQLNPGGTTKYTEIARKTYPVTQTNWQYTGKLTLRLSEDHSLALAVYGNPTRISGSSLGNATEAAGLYDAVTDSTDLSLRYQGKLLAKSMLIEAGVSYHRQAGSPGYAPNVELGPVQGLSAAQRMSTPGVGWSSSGFPAGTFYNLTDPRFDDGTLPDYQKSRAVLDACSPTTSGFNPCPVSGWSTGGGGLRDRSLARTAFLLKLSNFVEALGHHQLKYGVDAWLDRFEIRRWQTGNVSFTVYPAYDQIEALSYGTASPSQRDVPLTDGSGDPFSLKYNAPFTSVRNRSVAAFAQDTWAILDKVVLDAGFRWEHQALAGDSADSVDGYGRPVQPGSFTLDNFMPRVGLIWDWTGRGLSKAYASFGRFYEYVPLDLADRSLTSGSAVTWELQYSNCKDPKNLRTCRLYTEGDPLGATVHGIGIGWGMTGVDPKLQGQYVDEVQAGVQLQVFGDVAVGVDYVRKQVGRVIEDLSTDDGSTFVISNPAEPGKLGYQSVGNGGPILFPAPRRVYDGLTLSVLKRFSAGWFASASWTYSSLRGNYTGLFLPEYGGQLDPNITAEFDLARFLVNRDGPLPGDVPNSFKADAGWVHELDAATVIKLGGSFRLDQGGPTNYLAASAWGANTVYLLPRGIGPRLPWLWQIDLRAQAVRRLGKGFELGLTADLINLTDNQAATAVSQSYTTGSALPIVNGRVADLAYLRATSGAPVTVNPAFLLPTEYQLPFTVRVGLRLSF